jgi:hypothetical protein
VVAHNNNFANGRGKKRPIAPGGDVGYVESELHTEVTEAAEARITLICVGQGFFEFIAYALVLRMYILTCSLLALSAAVTMEGSIRSLKRGLWVVACCPFIGFISLLFWCGIQRDSSVGHAESRENPCYEHGII